MAPCTKTIIFALFMLLLLLLCFDSFSLSGGLVQSAEEGAANSAHPRTRRSDEGTDMVEVKPMMMRKLLEDIDFQLDYSPPGANPKHEVPPPAGKGKP